MTEPAYDARAEMSTEELEAIEVIEALGLSPRAVFPAWYASVFDRPKQAVSTIARPHQRYGYSRHGAGRIAHTLRELHLRWRDGKIVGQNYQWECGASTYKAILTPEPPDFLDVCVRCEAAVERLDAREQTSVYFAFAETTGQIKIGFTADVKRRMRQIRPAVELITAVPGGRRLEAELHQRFAHLRVAGEWFQADAELTDFIDALAEDVA